MPRIDRRTLLQGLSGLALGTWLDGCGGGGGGGGGASGPLVPQPRPSGSLTAIPLTISPTALGSVVPNFAGLSYEKSSMAVPRFTPDNTDLIGLFRRLGPSLLRLGAGSVDSMHWTPNGAGRTSGQVAPSDIDALAGFLAQTGWTILYGVNLATSTPAAAAAEVAYAVKALGSSLYGVEFGNECDEYPKHHFPPTWSLTDFVALWEQFRAAVLQAAPQVVLTGPGSAVNISGWTIPFGEKVTKAQIALLTQHYYRGDGRSPSSTEAELVSADHKLQQDLKTLAAGAASIGVPFRITETNSFFHGGAPGVSDSYGSSLWVIDHLFTIAAGGASGANLHGGGAGFSYSPIADNGGVVIEAKPEYYGVLLFTLAGQGSLLNTSVAANGLNVTAYTVKAADGTLSIVVVNKEVGRNLQLDIECGQMVNSVRILAMSGPALEATSGVKIQGAAVAANGDFTPGPAYTSQFSGSTVTCYVDALGAILLKVA
jgi:hypothetical protein